MKYTVLLHLSDLGLEVVEEPARQILSEQRLVDGRGVRDRDPRLFVELMTSRAIFEYKRMEASQAPVLFDRGVPDNIAYAALFNLDFEPGWNAARIYRYSNLAFFVPSWEEIYSYDKERTMSFEQAARFGDLIRDTYRELGYTTVEVPCDSSEHRARFILDSLPEAGA